jgi:hypothetical protein
LKLKKVQRHRFLVLKDAIEDYLYGKKLHLPLLEEKVESMKADEWTLLDRQVLGVVWLTLSRLVVYNVVKDKATTGLMVALSSMYEEKKSPNKKLHLMKKLYNFKMQRVVLYGSI